MTVKTKVKVDRISVVPRGAKGTYHAEFHFAGQHCRKSLKTANLRLAKERARELNAQITRGEFGATRERVGILDAIERYVAHAKSMGRANGTIDCYRHALLGFQQCMAARSLRTLDAITVSIFEEHILDLRQRLDPTTVYNQGVIIKQFVKWAAARGLMADHVLKHCSLTKPQRKRRFVPELSDVWHLLDAAAAQMPPLAVLAMTGMRRGELQRLLVEDIDLRKGWIDIVSRPGLETKTRRSWRVPIHPVLHEILAAYRFPKAGFAFVQPDIKSPLGTRWLHVNELGRQLRDLAKSLGLKVGRVNCGLTLHSFRRFMETHAINHGVPPRCVDSWLGHNSDQSMGAVYYSLTDEQSQSFMQALPFARPRTDT